jgi:hypothetical protein
MGVGAGVDALSAHVSSNRAAHAVAHHGSTAVRDAIDQPGSFVQGVEQGVSAEVHEATNLLTLGVQHAASAAATDSSFLVAGSPSCLLVSSLGLRRGGLAHY